MSRRPSIGPVTDTLSPDTSLFRSDELGVAGDLGHGRDLHVVAGLVDLEGGGHREDDADRLAGDDASRHERAAVAQPVDLEADRLVGVRSEEHQSELQSLMRNTYAVFRLKKKKRQKQST